MSTKCLKITLYFYRDDLEKDQVWPTGMAYIPKDQVLEGAPVRRGTMFNGMSGMAGAIADVLERNGFDVAE